MSSQRSASGIGRLGAESHLPGSFRDVRGRTTEPGIIEGADHDPPAVHGVAAGVGFGAAAVRSDSNRTTAAGNGLALVDRDSPELIELGGDHSGGFFGKARNPPRKSRASRPTSRAGGGGSTSVRPFSVPRSSRSSPAAARDDPVDASDPVRGRRLLGARKSNFFPVTTDGLNVKKQTRIGSLAVVHAYVLGTATGLLGYGRRRPVFDFVVNMLLRGAGQVCLTNNPIAGLFTLVGLAVNGSAAYTLFGVAGLITSTLVAIMLGAEKSSLRSGLFGFNGLLVGHALATLMYDVSEPNATTASLLYGLFGVFMTSAFAVILTIGLGNALVQVFHVPPFTLPFNLSTMAFLVCAGLGRNFLVSPGLAPSLIERPDAADASVKYLQGWFNEGYFSDAMEVLYAILRGFSQVFLSDDPLAGLFIAVGIGLTSRISLAAATLGSAVGLFVGMYFGVPRDALLAGLWGYNPLLTAIVTGGLFFVPSLPVAGLTFFSAAFTAVVHGAITGALAPVGLPPMTIPFCLVSILTMLLGSSVKRVVPVSLVLATTPEHHYADRQKAVLAIVAQKFRLNGRRRRALCNLALLERAFAQVHPPTAGTGSCPVGPLLAVLDQAGYASHSQEVQDALEALGVRSAAERKAGSVSELEAPNHTVSFKAVMGLPGRPLPGGTFSPNVIVAALLNQRNELERRGRRHRRLTGPLSVEHLSPTADDVRAPLLGDNLTEPVRAYGGEGAVYRPTSGYNTLPSANGF